MTKLIEKRIQHLVYSRNLADLEEALGENKNLSLNNAYLLVQSLIKTSRFINAEDLLNSHFFSGEIEKPQYLKFKYDLAFSRRNFPEAVKVAQALIAKGSDKRDSKFRLAKALCANNELFAAHNIAIVLKNSFPESSSVISLLKEIEEKKSEFIRNKLHNTNINRKYTIADYFDLADIHDQGCSVVVPCFNVEKFVGRTIQSIIDCGHSKIEIILVEDCSTDRTLSILMEYYEKNKQTIRIIRHKKNSGLAAARNTGLAAASMQYVTFIDSDDLMVKGGVTRRVNSLRSVRLNDDRFIGSYGGSVTIDEDTILPPESQPVKGMKIVDYLSTDGLCPFNANQPLFITEFLRLTGGFPESERTAEDWPFWLLLLRMGGKITPTHSIDVTYRMRKNSMVRVTAAKHLDSSFKILNSIEEEEKLLYSKPYHKYSVQKNFIERYYNFFGLRIASSYEKNKSSSKVSKELSKEFIDGLKTYIPDFLFINSDVKFIKSRIIHGIQRYYCVSSIDKIDCAKELKYIARGFALGANSYASSLLIEKRRLSYTNLLDKIDVVFLPHKEYHARSAELIGNHLSQLGLTWRIVDFSCLYGDEGVSEYLKFSNAPALTINQLTLGLYPISTAVVFNDWDPTVKSILKNLKDQGARTIGIVEGVNDYLSVDTGVWRPAYRFVDTLFIPGKFHLKYFSEHKSIYTVGVQRLDPLLSRSNKLKPTLARKLTCVINCNFTYGVLVEHRIYFLKTICDVLLDLGITPIISRHPQDIGDIGEYQSFVTQKSIYELLEETKIFITRFSGAVYEGLLSGAHVVYFNPGIERWDMFFDPSGAYSYVENSDKLRSVIQKILVSNFELSKSREFLQNHCDINDSETSSSQKTANAINEIIQIKENAFEINNDADPVSFFDHLRKVHEFIDAKEYDMAFRLLKLAAETKVAKNVTQNKMLDTENKRLNRLAGGKYSLALLNQKIIDSASKNLFLIFSCVKYSERMKILRGYYSKGLHAGDKFIFVIGGAEADFLDGDVLHLRCGDSYERLPEKVFCAFRYACQNFDFDRIVKIDDDIFVNFNNFYKVISSKFRYDYYGRKNPPDFGHPLNPRWHYGKVSKGHRYDGKEFPLVEPAQWCSGGCYIVSKRAAEHVASYHDNDFVENHLFEDYMIFDILSSFDVYPSFHENSSLQELVWMEPSLDRVLDISFSSINGEFDMFSFITIHCGSTNKYKVENSDLERIFSILDRNLHVPLDPRYFSIHPT